MRRAHWDGSKSDIAQTIQGAGALAHPKTQAQMEHGNDGHVVECSAASSRHSVLAKTDAPLFTRWNSSTLGTKTFLNRVHQTYENIENPTQNHNAYPRSYAHRRLHEGGKKKPPP